MNKLSYEILWTINNEGKAISNMDVFEHIIENRKAKREPWAILESFIMSHSCLFYFTMTSKLKGVLLDMSTSIAKEIVVMSRMGYLIEEWKEVEGEEYPYYSITEIGKSVITNYMKEAV